MRNYSSPSNTQPRYDPVIIHSPTSDISLTNLKEYETQILGMAVNEEQDDMQIDYSAKNHSFENKSYMKDQDQSSPTNFDSSTLQRNNRINFLNNINQKQNKLANKLENKSIHATKSIF